MVGMMGAGKSSVGRRLAAALELPFVDADAEIESAANQTIAEIFQKYGEQHFREGERKVIARILKAPQQVVATGGGAIVDTHTRRTVKRRSVSVWLRADIDVLLERVLRKSDRPLLKEADPRAVLERLSKDRESVYASADIIVNSREGPHAEVVSAIIGDLEDRLEKEMAK